MDVQVIETKRSPPIWSVKAGRRYVASYMGADARKKAEREARKLGDYTIKEKPPLASERKRHAAEKRH